MRIRLLNDYKLAQDLKQGKVSEKEQAVYLALFVIFATIFVSPTLVYNLNPDAQAPNIYAYIADLIWIIAISLTVLLTYKINTIGGQKDFVTRYIAISTPLAVQLFFITIICIGFFESIYENSYRDMMSTGLDVADADILEEAAGEITDVEIAGNEVNTTIASNPGTVLGMLIVSAYAIWRYTSCFEIINGKAKTAPQTQGDEEKNDTGNIDDIEKNKDDA